jgi:GNAT superfamily N-acetyltransferase
MTAPVTVRLATPDDAAALSGLILRTLYQVNVGDYEPIVIAAWAKDWTVDEVAAKMRHRTTYVAVLGDVIVGTAGFDGRQIKSVFVAPEQHKLGIGALLVRTVETLAMERGLDRLSLHSSITAEGFYRRLGYAALRDIFHGAERTILMEKRLGS